MHRFFIIMFLGLMLTACQGSSPTVMAAREILTPTLPAARIVTPTGTQPVTPTITRALSTLTPTPEPLPDEMSMWKISPHANQNIICETCHAKRGLPALAWRNPKTGKSEMIAKGYELCEKCHTEMQIPPTAPGQAATVHSGFECLNCHNPHSTAASCSSAGCHDALVKTPVRMPPATPVGGHPYIEATVCGGTSCHPAATQAALSSPTVHGAAHARVSCAACHDASGLQVGPSEVDGVWTTLQTIETNGAAALKPFVSHTLQTAVDCKRCHFEGNTWKLPLVTGHEFGN